MRNYIYGYKILFYYYVIGDWQAKHLVPRRERASEFPDGGSRLGRDGGLVLSTSAADGTTDDLLDLVWYRCRRRTTSSRTDGGCSHLIYYFVLR